VRVAIFTKDIMNPPHPRIQMEMEILRKHGFLPTLFHGHSVKPQKLYDKICYFLTLTFFRWDLIRLFKLKEIEFDVVIIYDFSLLPLTRFYNKKGVRVIYEIIDDNTELIAYHIVKKRAWLAPFIHILKGRLKKMEHNYVDAYCDNMIINSDNLRYIHPAKAVSNYYASPFESISLQNDPQLPPAFIYLGLISSEKGWQEMLELRRKFKIPLFLYGNFSPTELSHTLTLESDVYHQKKLDSNTLALELTALASKFRLIGISLIKSVNESYAFQEANKDIDYLALGIPFVGNNRGSTKEKIEAGVGVFHEDENGILGLIQNPQMYAQKQRNAFALYAQKYARRNFDTVLISLLPND